MSFRGDAVLRLDYLYRKIGRESVRIGGIFIGTACCLRRPDGLKEIPLIPVANDAGELLDLFGRLETRGLLPYTSSSSEAVFAVAVSCLRKIGAGYLF
jgi:hypothetical protein